MLSICNDRLLKICVPDNIKRKPRSIEDSGHWKGIVLCTINIFHCIKRDRYDKRDQFA